MITLSRYCLAVLLLLQFVWGQNLIAQSGASIEGTIKDAQTGDGLPGANVMLVGTGLGASTNPSGKYTIRNVPPGSYALRVSYIGYRTLSITLQVPESGSITRDVKMDAVAVEGETVVVTAQASGQNEAINKQLSSEQIVNVVSAARIRELPDANAAEAVARLPGVSVLREGGEGNKLVIRGLAPKYNAVMLDGVRLSSTDSSDRSVDLSMISPDVLEGIEVMKAITPDQDGDALGGSVNFIMKEASGGHPGFTPDLTVVGSYNNLMGTYNDYKVVGRVSSRFDDERFGVFAQGELEQRNRTSNELNAAYAMATFAVNSPNPLDITSLGLNTIGREKQRGGGSLVLDYRLPDGGIKMTNLINVGTTHQTSRSQSYDIKGNNEYYNLNDSKTKLTVLANILTAEQRLGIVKLDAALSHSFSGNSLPSGFGATFYEQGAGLNRADLRRVPPNIVPLYANDSLGNTQLFGLSAYSRESSERAFSAALNGQIDANISSLITGSIKVGGKVKNLARTFDYQSDDGGNIWYSGGTSVRQAIAAAYPWISQASNNGNDRLPMGLFLDPVYSFPSFFRGEYKMHYPVNADLMKNILKIASSATGGEGYHPNAAATIQDDYNGRENTSAGYIMANYSLGPDLKIIPGVRYEAFRTSYTGRRVNTTFPGSNSTVYSVDTTVSRLHENWLPMVHLRYKPLPWFDIRFAYTNTVTYPDYTTIIPRVVVTNTSVDWNNTHLKSSRSENLDLYASAYDNSIGLFTVGIFSKKIHDLIFFSKIYVIDYRQYEWLGPATNSLELRTYVNNPNVATVKGIEFDWQTHFWYLPGILSSLVLNINYTHITSEAQYPRSELLTEYLEVPPYVLKTEHDTTYSTRLLYQPNDIVNVSVGFDYSGFSARVSLIYHNDIFKLADFWPENRVTTDKYLRWDIAIKQDLPWFGLQAFLNLNNVNGRNDVDLINGNNFPQAAQEYGMTADLGLRWTL